MHSRRLRVVVAVQDIEQFFLLKLLASVVAPGGRLGGLSILIYHRVLSAPDPMNPDEPDAETFEWQMATVASHFAVLPLAEAIERLYRGTLPPRAAAITFDDGYADNVDVALPVLLRYGLPATFFVATGFLDGGRMWNDSIIEAVRRAPGAVLRTAESGGEIYPIRNAEQRYRAATSLIRSYKHLPPTERARAVRYFTDAIDVALPRTLMMTSAQVRTLVDHGMDVGGHTANHPILTALSDDDVRTEIVAGKRRLEEITERRVRLFAYPNGRPGQDYAPRHATIVRELGFDAAVSTAWGVGRRTSARYELPRFTPWDRTPRRYLSRLVQNCLR